MYLEIDAHRHRADLGQTGTVVTLKLVMSEVATCFWRHADIDPQRRRYRNLRQWFGY